MSAHDHPSPPPHAAFVTTHWTRVLQARGDTPEARTALSELCEAYWAPIFRFLCREGRTEDAARELTQEFFAGLLARHGLDTVEPGRGRFRSFLLGALKHFLADRRDREHAAKRGGGQAPESLDASADTSIIAQVPDPAGPPPDTFFDRQWALTIMARALAALEAEFQTAGKEEHFKALKPWLVGETEALPQAEAARHLGLNEGAVKVAIHRLRRRFRELVKCEISRTVDDGNHAEEELRYLVDVLSSA
jgi:RNA polymerase sigma factor (sigma-70 family)